MERREIVQEVFKYLRSKGLAHTQKDIANKLGTSAPNVSNAFKGVEKFLTTNFLIRLNGAYNNIFNEAWLLTGEGEMLAPSPPDIIQSGNGVNSVNKAGTTNINNASEQQMESILKRCEDASERASKMIDTATSLIALAQNTMQAALDLQRDMKQDRQHTLDLYDKMYSIQREHIAKSREWIEGSMDNIKSLRKDIKQMIDEQTQEQEEALQESNTKIIKFCATYNPTSNNNKSSDYRPLRKEA